MLVIRRHPGDAILIGEDVEIVVIDCGSGRVKLGIRAPKHVAVMRSEVRHTREQNLRAALAIGCPELEISGESRPVIPFLADAQP